jgi:ABC-type amino acid transport substrate-binding protein
MSQVENGEKDAIVFSFHNSQSAHLFTIPEESLGKDDSTSFAVSNRNSWQLSNVESLHTLKHIGAYKGTIWSNKKVADFEQKQQHKFIYLHGDNIVERAFDMLRRGRLDAWEDSETLLNYYIYSKGITDLRIERLTNAKVVTGDILFSAKNPRSVEYAAFFSAGLKQMRKNGQLNVILKKYGLRDWK